MKLISAYAKYLYLAGIILFFALALVLLTASDSQAHCCATVTPSPTFTATATPTPTLTPTPQLRACQVTAVVFGRESYLAGDTINVTVRVADFAGTPLVGANVNAEVTRQPLAAQAAVGFGLVDRAGDYDGVFSNTADPGLYVFQFTVSDPTGKRFLPCTGAAEILVAEPATPTPTFTPTPTATATPTITPTPTSQPGVRVLPQQLTTTLCSLRDTLQVRVENVANLAVVQMQLSYDRQVVQVIDADAAQRGVQVRVDPAFATGSIFENQVDTLRGEISFGAGVIGVPAINGSSSLIAIDFRPQQVGATAVSIDSISLLDVNGQPIAAQVSSGSVTVEFVPNCLEGTVALQGRSDHSGVTVTNAEGRQTITLADGSFSIPASNTLNFDYPGFMAARADVTRALAAAAADQPVVLQPITLPAGDINADNAIDLLDLGYLAANFLTANGLADLNGDGAANIIDLTLLAGNYKLRGPVLSQQ
ncbi:MAG: hypothetical protein FOGNACKC_00639 [Anaerolineae bacterium]|nr:hypothetical protein [Anaerolineae bacterium]